MSLERKATTEMKSAVGGTMRRSENRCSPGRRALALFGLWGIVVLLAGFWAVPLSFPWLEQHRDMVKKIRAGWMGARFVGDEGVVLQARWNDCGAASLQMVLAAHGINRDIRDLARSLRLTPRGTSMSELRRAAFEFGVPARSWAIQPRELKLIPLPAVAFIKGNHFVVVRRWIEPDVLEIDDPALGRLRWPLRSFARIWSGETLVFDPAWTPR
jgi:hypothetical protein